MKTTMSFAALCEAMRTGKEVVLQQGKEPCVIQGIEREDGSGYKFNLQIRLVRKYEGTTGEEWIRKNQFVEVEW